MKLAVYNQGAEKIRDIDASERYGKALASKDLMHQVVVSMLSNARLGLAKAKDRGEVRGGGRKPWKQKGTGRARHGSTRSPIWVGGGVTHGPVAEKRYDKKIGKGMRRRALESAITAKIHDGEALIVDKLEFSEMKTKNAEQFIQGLVKAGAFPKSASVLMVIEQSHAPLMRVFRNLRNVSIVEVRNMNTAIVLQYQYLLFTEKAFYGTI